MDHSSAEEGGTDELALSGIRNRIDSIDSQLLALISERARCAEEVARIKRAGGQAVAFYRAEREAQVLRSVRERNPGPLGDDEIARLFREIMSSCLAHEQPLRIAYFGPAGSYTHTAALRHFGGAAALSALPSIAEVFREVGAAAVDYGVVPVENSSEGVVSHTLDLFLNSPLQICGEVVVRIHHNLLGLTSSLTGIRRVVAHPQALGQCRRWLDQHLPAIERVEVANNAEGARLAAADPEVAAIASDAASEIYSLGIIARNIEDEPDNTTRFLVIGAKDVPPSGDDRTSLLISARNRPGALFSLLEPLARHGISMSRIESRPSRRGVWDYVFFVDVLGHRLESPLQQALAELEHDAPLLRVLGSYPRSSG